MDFFWIWHEPKDYQKDKIMELPARILAIGESHAKYNFKDIREVEVNSIGSVTMHRVGRDQMEFQDTIVPGCMAIFCFGEIDVRMHIHKQVLLGRDEDDIINLLVLNYMNAIIKQFKNNVIPVIMSITPANATEPNPMAVGSNADRSRYCRKLNEKLAEYCTELNIDFLNVYHRYADEQGMLRTELADREDGYHIGKPDMIIDEFHKMLDRMRAR